MVTVGEQFIFDGGTTLSFDVGDWLIFNGDFWEKITNTGTVSRVFNRIGNIKTCPGSPGCPVGVYDYSWEQIVKFPPLIELNNSATKSSIFDITNVEKPNHLNDIPINSTLSWDHVNSRWSITPDAVGISGNVKTSDIVAPFITADDIADGESKL